MILHVIAFAYIVLLDFLSMDLRCYVSFPTSQKPCIQTREQILGLEQKHPKVEPHNHFLKPIDD